MDDSVLVADNELEVRHAVRKLATTLGYGCKTASTATEALAEISKAPCGILLTDLLLTDMDGLELGRRAREIDPDVAVVLMTAQTSPAVARGGARLGVCDYLEKPVTPEGLQQSLEYAAEWRAARYRRRAYQGELERLIKERALEIRDTYRETLRALGSALDTRDPETQGHSGRVLAYTLRIAREMGIKGTDLQNVERGALLHDVGKIGIPDGILFKPSRLSPAEWQCMRNHTLIGYNMLKDIPFLRGALPTVRSHHERFGAGGYPDDLEGDDIPLGARIFAVADAIDAMTSERPYQKACPLDRALGELEACAGSQFDSKVVKAMLGLVERGSWGPVTDQERLGATESNDDGDGGLPGPLDSLRDLGL